MADDVSKHDGFKVAVRRADQSPVLIQDVVSGLRCDCICMGCGRPLVAVHPASRSAYFRHHNPIQDPFDVCLDSKGNSESITHYLVKHHIHKQKQLKLPAYYIRHPKDSDGFVYQPYKASAERIITFDDVVLEKREGSFIPDCIGVVGDRRLLIEVCVTHKVDTDKLQKVKDVQLPMVELVVKDKIESETSPLLDKVISSTENTEWLNAPVFHSESVTSKAQQFFQKQRQEHDQILTQRRNEEMLQKKNKAVSDRMEEWDLKNLNSTYYFSSTEWDKDAQMAKCKAELRALLADVTESIANRIEREYLVEADVVANDHRLWLEIEKIIPDDYPLYLSNKIKQWISVHTRVSVNLFDSLVDEQVRITKLDTYHLWAKYAYTQAQSESGVKYEFDRWLSEDRTMLAFEKEISWDQAIEYSKAYEFVTLTSIELVQHILILIEQHHKMEKQIRLAQKQNSVLLAECKQVFIGHFERICRGLIIVNHQIIIHGADPDVWVNQVARFYYDKYKDDHWRTIQEKKLGERLAAQKSWEEYYSEKILV